MQQYQEHIEPDVPQAQVPEELHPVAAAFGGDIGAALEKTGNQVSSRIEQLVNHMATMNYYRGQQAVADKVLEMKNQQNSFLYGDPNDPNATVTKTRPPIEGIGPDADLSVGTAPSSTAPYAASEPKSYEVPAGILQRKGNQAAGALQDYHDWYTSYSQQMIDQARNEGLGARNIKSMKIRMDNDFASNGRYIAQHEATELDKAQQQTFLKGMQLDADNAITRQDPTTLGRTIDSINEQNKTLNDSQGKAEDDPVRELTSNKFVGIAVKNSVNQLMKTTGSPDPAYDLIDKLHDTGKINDTVYTEAKDNIDKGFKVLQEQADRTVRTQQTNGRMNLVNMAVQGKIDWSNPTALNDVAQTDPQAYTAINNYVLNAKNDVKPDDAAFADAVDKVYTSGSKEQIANFTMNILKENNGKISQDKLNILFSSAMDRGKHLADLQEDAAGHNKNPLQNAIDGGMKALFGWTKEQKTKDAQVYADYMNYIKSKASPSEAYNASITNAIIRSNPAVASLATPPNFVIGKDSPIKYVFPRTNRKKDGSTDK